MIPTSYPAQAEIARLTARMLLEIKAVHFNAADPFILASGLPSPTYIDCAERMALPMTYVRKKPKGYGKGARIEGDMHEGQRVLLVEDLTTDGGSKLSFVDAIRDTGAHCADTAVIFYYGIFEGTEQNLADHGIALHYLCTWWDVLAEARAQNAFDEATLAGVEDFLNAPNILRPARHAPQDIVTFTQKCLIHRNIQFASAAQHFV